MSTWTYKNVLTGEEIISDCIDSRYWTPEWECIAGDEPDIFDAVRELRHKNPEPVKVGLNYDDVEPASEARIAHIKEVAQTVEPYSWNNYDVLSLIKVIEELEGKIQEYKDNDYYKAEAEQLDY